MKRNKVVAITGGIGSGKSTVLTYINELGGITASADDFNRDLLKDEEYLLGLKKLFPTAFVNGRFVKSVLRDMVFFDKQQLKILNEYAHAAIWKKIKEVVESSDENIFVEIPLLNGDDCHIDMFDRIWVVVSSLSVKRAALRDNVSEENIILIASNQINDSDRKLFATDVIFNDGDISELKKTVEELYFSLK